MAIFVEGMTEQEFAIALVSHLAGSRGLHIVLGRQWRGKVTIVPNTPPPGTNFYVLIVDCANDEQVKTQVRDNYSSLVASGYTAILGLRDVYPLTRADIPTIQAGLPAGLPSSPLLPKIHLAVMEVEAWFLSETTHFSRIHTALTVPFIVARGFDVAGLLGDSWHHPAEVLDNIYSLANKRYLTSKGKKTNSRVIRTIRALSFGELRTTVRGQLHEFEEFLSNIEQELFASP